MHRDVPNVVSPALGFVSLSLMAGTVVFFFRTM